MNERLQYLRHVIYHQGYVLTSKMEGQTMIMSVCDVVAPIKLTKLGGWRGGEWSEYRMAVTQT